MTVTLYLADTPQQQKVDTSAYWYKKKLVAFDDK